MPSGDRSRLQSVDTDRNGLLSLPEAQAYILKEYGISNRDVERIWRLVVRKYNAVLFSTRQLFCHKTQNIACIKNCEFGRLDEEAERLRAPPGHSTIRAPRAICSRERGGRYEDAARCLQCGRVDMICELFGNSRSAVSMQRSPNCALRSLTLSKMRFSPIVSSE